MTTPIELEPASIQPLGCPFCDGSVKHPALVVGEPSRMEIRCDNCNLTMHEKVGGDGGQDAQDYARFRLMGAWSRRVKVPGANPVPNAVYFDEEQEKFFHGPMGSDMGDEFLEKWLPRADEFPKRREDTRGF